MKIQIPYSCKKYKPNDNLNKTCDNKTRCVIYYDEICEEYNETTNNNTNCADSNSACQPEQHKQKIR